MDNENEQHQYMHVVLQHGVGRVMKMCQSLGISVTTKKVDGEVAK